MQIKMTNTPSQTCCCTDAGFTAQQKEARRERDTTRAPERPTHTPGQNTFPETST